MVTCVATARIRKGWQGDWPTAPHTRPPPRARGYRPCARPAAMPSAGPMWKGVQASSSNGSPSRRRPATLRALARPCPRRAPPRLRSSSSCSRPAGGPVPGRLSCRAPHPRSRKSSTGAGRERLEARVDTHRQPPLRNAHRSVAWDCRLPRDAQVAGGTFGNAGDAAARHVGAGVAKPPDYRSRRFTGRHSGPQPRRRVTCPAHARPSGRRRPGAGRAPRPWVVSAEGHCWWVRPTRHMGSMSAPRCRVGDASRGGHSPSRPRRSRGARRLGSRARRRDARSRSGRQTHGAGTAPGQDFAADPVDADAAVCDRLDRDAVPAARRREGGAEGCVDLAPTFRPVAVTDPGALAGRVRAARNGTEEGGRGCLAPGRGRRRWRRARHRRRPRGWRHLPSGQVLELDPAIRRRGQRGHRGHRGDEAVGGRPEFRQGPGRRLIGSSGSSPPTALRGLPLRMPSKAARSSICPPCGRSMAAGSAAAGDERGPRPPGWPASRAGARWEGRRRDRA